MSNHHESKMSRLVTFRAPEALATAMEAAAARQFSSVSVIARTAAVKMLRAEGLLSDENAK